MRLPRWKKYGIGAGGVLVLATAFLMATGWGSAVAAQITNVFVTNDSAHPVPVHEQGTANVRINDTVSVAAKQPANAFSYRGVGTQLSISSPNLPAGTNWYISSVSGANFGDTPHEVFLFLGCGQPGVYDGPSMVVSPNDTIQLTFPQPFVMRQAVDNACLTISAPYVVWNIVGYHD
jgi:hypothetical protein